MDKANLEQLPSFVTAETGQGQLVLLCCCAPAYSDDDTVMTGR
jgi:hypothetical protein